MRNLLVIVFILFLTSITHCADAQKTANQKQPLQSKILDSVQWRKDNYIVNRDSAFLNPYYALQN